MENAQKALIMAGSVLMFLIALSVAVFQYNTVREIIGTILTVSENNDRTAEYFVETDEDTERHATKAEVVMTIISMFNSSGYSASTVTVNGKSFSNSDDRISVEEKIKDIPEGNYSISYSGSDGYGSTVNFKLDNSI